MTGPEGGPVVVAVDGSDDGRRALRYAVGLAGAYGAPLRLVHVRHENVMLSPMLPLFPDPTLGEIAQHVLDGAVHDAERFGWTGPAIDAVLASGPRVAALLDHTRDARCLVVGRRSSTAEHLFTGSTTNGVVAHCEVPVLSVPDSWNPEVRFHQVTVGIDDTPEAETLAEAAAQAAADLDAGVVVLHAWRPSGQYDAAVGQHGPAQRWETGTRPVVDGILEPVRARHPNIKIDVELRYQQAATALHSLSRDSDLVVIGRHARHRRFSPLVGGTAHTVLRTSTCPVLVVPLVHAAERG